MKQRIITSAVALMALAVFFILYNSVVTDIVVALAVCIAIYEMFKAMKLWEYRGFSILSMIYGCGVLFSIGYMTSREFFFISLIYMTFSFIYIMKRLDTLKVEKMFFGILVSAFLGYAFSVFLSLKYSSNAQIALFYLLMGLGSAWWSDAGAYFSGTFFGKHKLCPHVSPKKTVEGLVGGIVVAVIGNVLVALGYMSLCNKVAPFGYLISNTISVNILKIVLVTPILALVGVLGDLSASIIKRQTGIKDYGNLFPGHGGIMDRFDSVLFILPYLYVIFNVFPLLN